MGWIKDHKGCVKELFWGVGSVLHPEQVNIKVH